jgi:3-deoxy-7-phosphoheptulonate synthase
LLLKELSHFLEDVQVAREAYLKRVGLVQKYRES